MTLLNDALLKRLAARRLMPLWAAPVAPDGDRRGNQTGSGMEFADHREYHAGDDLRHLDSHAYARLRRPYVKVFAADRGLDVAILVDASPSMTFGNPTKLRVAAELATALAYVGIAGGDRVRLASFSDGSKVSWRPVVTSVGNINVLVGGLDQPLPAARETDLRSVAVATDRILPSSGLTIVLSDWWTADPELTVRSFSRSGREVVVVQILAPEEEEPGRRDEGWTRLVDAEDGQSLDLSLDAGIRNAYVRGLAEWRARLEGEVGRVRGRLLTVRSDQSPSRVVLDDWREAGLIR